MTESAINPGMTRKLATWAAELQYDDLPQDVVVLAKRQILDTLAVSWAGTMADAVEPVIDLARRQGGDQQATIWGFPGKLPAPQAAFVNGMLAAALDFDSLHDKATVHPDVVVIPASFALGELLRANGRELITAVVVGSEITVRLGLAAKIHPGWFYSSVFGIFGGAAASARMLQLGPDGVLNAMGIAMSQAAGTQQALLERSLAKRLQTAFAARNGVEAALLAQAGITGPSQPFEGACGIGKLYTPMDSEFLGNDLGRRYEMRGMSLKKYASCMCNHAPIEATLRLLDAGEFNLAAVEGIEVTISPFMHRLVGAPFAPGSNPQVAAQFSVQYSVASALTRRRFDAGDIAAEMVGDRTVCDLAARVEVKIDESGGKFVPASLAVRMNDGTVLRSRVETLPGSPDAPLTEGEAHQKAKTCFGSAKNPLAAARAETFITTINQLEKCDDLSQLLS